MDKNKIIGLASLAIGVATLLFQMKLLREEGSFYVFGVLSSALIVLGIAALCSVNLSDAQFENEDGSKSNVSFGDMPTPIKITMVLALAAAAGQFAFFTYGPVL